MMKLVRLLFPVGTGIGLALAYLLCLPWQMELARGEAAIRYVDKSGADQGDCAQPQDACRTIQYAIDRAQEGDEVRIAGGVYTDVNDYAGSTQVAYISKTVSLRGGYTLTNWITPEFSSHPTVLDARTLGRVVYITGSITSTMEGLRLTGGSMWIGGGLYVVDSTVTISACEIVSNTSGGGGGSALFESSQVTLRDSSITGSLGSGGGEGVVIVYGRATLARNTIKRNSNSGVLLAYVDTASILSNTISGNTAHSGGGIYINNSNVLIEGNIIQGNAATNDGGGIYHDDFDAGVVEIVGNYIISNTSGHFGGGVYGPANAFSENLVSGNHALYYGGGAGLIGSPNGISVIISNNDFISNSTTYGKGNGLFYSMGELSIVSNTFQSNSSIYGNGGGLYIEQVQVSMIANNFQSNTADEGGGAAVYDSEVFAQSNVYVDNTSGAGGGLLTRYSNISLVDNIFRGNKSDVGGGFYLYYSNAELIGNRIISNTSSGHGGGAYLLDSPALIGDNVIAENASSTSQPWGWGGGMVLDGSSVTMTNNLIVDNQSANLGSGIILDRVEEAHLIQNTFARNHGGAGDAIFMASDSHLYMTNTIIVSQTIGLWVNGGIQGSSALLEGTLWGSGEWANEHDWFGDGEIYTGTVNVWGDPKFIDPDAGDYHLSLGSAAIDAGVDSNVLIDIDRQPRPAGDGFDIGADEFWLDWLWHYLPLLLR